jgi:hypothetical protein
MRRTGLFLGALAIASFVGASQASAQGRLLSRLFYGGNNGCYCVSSQNAGEQLERPAELPGASQQRVEAPAPRPFRDVVPTDPDTGPYRVYGTWKCWDDEGDRVCGWDYTNFDRPRDRNYSPEYDPDS